MKYIVLIFAAGAISLATMHPVPTISPRTASPIQTPIAVIPAANNQPLGITFNPQITMQGSQLQGNK